MNARQIMDEYDLSIDDIRWYLSRLKARSLLEMSDEPAELTRRIWSGGLEAELYDMEERYLRDLQDQLSRDVIDETVVRDIMQEAAAAKRRRPKV
jgi:hypothetical protein